MKIIYYCLLTISVAFLPEYSLQAQEALIIDYLEINSRGVKTDLNINISKMNISKVTVADSVVILREMFEHDKALKIGQAENAAERRRKSVDEINQRIDSNDVSTMNKKMDKIVDETLRKVLWKILKKHMPL